MTLPAGVRLCALLICSGMFSGCDYSQIKEQNEALKKEVASLRKQNETAEVTNSGLNSKIAQMTSERDRLIIPVSSLKIEITLQYRHDAGVDASAEIPRLSPIAQLGGGQMAIEMFDPGLTPPRTTTDSNAISTMTFLFIPKNPETLDRVDLKTVEGLTTFRFRLRNMLSRLGISLLQDNPTSISLIVNGIKIPLSQEGTDLIEEADGWNTTDISDLTSDVRNIYLGYVQQTM